MVTICDLVIYNKCCFWNVYIQKWIDFDENNKIKINLSSVNYKSQKSDMNWTYIDIHICEFLYINLQQKDGCYIFKKPLYDCKYTWIKFLVWNI